eukprot:COSAG05_NODE_556_length_8706_cov_3.676659_2_plen_48_part_00
MHTYTQYLIRIVLVVEKYSTGTAVWYDCTGTVVLHYLWFCTATPHGY